MDIKLIQEFLIDLKFNNNRNWFQENKARFTKAQAEFNVFVDDLIENIKVFDDSINIDSSKQAIFRIYRDVRFSKNKEPYKTNFGAFISRDGRKSAFAGYYLHFEPDNYFLGGGIYQPDAKVLKAIRTDIYENSDRFKSIISHKSFKTNFSLMESDKLKTAPKGFPKDFEDIALLNYKHYAVMHKIENSFWEQENVMDNIMDLYKMQYPLNAYLNAIVEENM